MAQPLKTAAAKHSTEAFALVQAAQYLRRAARSLAVAGAEDAANSARAMAKNVDTRRRRMMSRGFPLNTR